MPVAEAREIVKPERLEDVLESLRGLSLIDFFYVTSSHVEIWENPNVRFDCRMFSQETNDKVIQLLKEKKKHG